VPVPNVMAALGKSPRNTTQQQPFYGPLSGTTRVSRYQKKHPPTILIFIQSLSASSIYHDP